MHAQLLERTPQVPTPNAVMRPGRQPKLVLPSDLLARVERLIAWGARKDDIIDLVPHPATAQTVQALFRDFPERLQRRGLPGSALSEHQLPTVRKHFVSMAVNFQLVTAQGMPTAEALISIYSRYWVESGFSSTIETRAAFHKWKALAMSLRHGAALIKACPHCGAHHILMKDEIASRNPRCIWCNRGMANRTSSEFAGRRTGTA